MKVKIGESEFKVVVADTDEKREVGLSTLDKLPKKHGLYMKFDNATRIPITTEKMKFPLDVLFIKDSKIQKIVPMEVGKTTSIGKDSDAVLEVNMGEGGKFRTNQRIELIGSKEEDGSISIVEGEIKASGNRHLLDDNGKVQMNLLGEERILSRKDTEKLLTLAKKKDYKKLGRFLVNVINKQDSQEPEFSNN
jgi:uncharacterized membrane protein (UPF0127 family)